MQVRDRVLDLRRVKASDLRANPKNWRRHPQTQAVALRSVLEKVGYAGALLARETPEGLELIDGHLRQEISGNQEVPVLVLDLDEAEADLILATLDPLGAMAQTDEQALYDLLQDVIVPDDVLARALEEMTGQAGPPAVMGDPDAVPDLPTEPSTKPGDLYLLGEHRLLCGDVSSIKGLSFLGQDPVETVFTDPPYGIGYEAMRGGAKLDNDATPALAGEVTGHALRALSAATEFFVCCDWRSLPTMLQAFAEVSIEPKACIVWDKTSRVQNLDRFAKQHEMILYSGPFGGQPTVDVDVWQVPRDFDPDHPTPKPVALVARALRVSTGIVADPFAGSGSTLIAAEQAGRIARLVEINPAYCDVIVARWEAFTGQSAERAA